MLEKSSYNVARMSCKLREIALGNMGKETSSSSIAAGCLDYCGMETMLHVTCAQYTKEQTLRHLEQSKAVGLKNILALRGDLPQVAFLISSLGYLDFF